MKTKKEGRIYISVPISLSPEELEFVNERVEELKPRVSGRSSYFQQLVQMDQECDLLKQGLAVVQARMLSGKRR